MVTRCPVIYLQEPSLKHAVGAGMHHNYNFNHAMYLVRRPSYLKSPAPGLSVSLSYCSIKRKFTHEVIVITIFTECKAPEVWGPYPEDGNC